MRRSLLKDMMHSTGDVLVGCVREAMKDLLERAE